MSERCCVYVIGPTPWGLVKVGISNEPQRRLRQLEKAWRGYYLMELGELVHKAMKGLGRKPYDLGNGTKGYTGAVADALADHLLYEHRTPKVLAALWLPSRGLAKAVEREAHDELKQLCRKEDFQMPVGDGSTEVFGVTVAQAVSAVAKAHAEIVAEIRKGPEEFMGPWWLEVCRRAVGIAEAVHSE